MSQELAKASEVDQHMMQLACDVAKRAMQMDEVPVGAVIYRGDQIVAQAHNLRESTNNPVAHAEILAIQEASRILGDWRLNECSLAVTLEPCVMCAGAIVNSRIGRLIYGATDPKAGAVDSLYHICEDRRLNHRPVVIRGVLSESCGDMLRDFFRQKRV